MTKDQIQKRLEALVTQHNQAVADRDAAESVRLKCMGAIEILQGIQAEMTAAEDTTPPLSPPPPAE